MGSRDLDRWRRPDSPPDRTEPSAAADVLEQGSRQPPRRWRHPLALVAILGVVGLLASFAVGYAVGNRHFRNAEAQLRGSTTLPTPPAGSRLTQSVVQCAAQPVLRVPTGAQPATVIPVPAPSSSSIHVFLPKPGGSAVYFDCVGTK